MKNALILHGAGNNSQGNWYPWLKKELQEKGYQVWCPDLPHAQEPSTEDWANVIFANPTWTFNKDTVLIGHSAGATLILRLLEYLPKHDPPIRKAILVAGFVELGTEELTYPYKKGLLQQPFRWYTIKNRAKEFIFFHSNNDPYQCGKAQGKILKEKIEGRGKLIIKPGQGHFNLETGPQYKEFPELLSFI